MERLQEREPNQLARRQHTPCTLVGAGPEGPEKLPGTSSPQASGGLDDSSSEPTDHIVFQSRWGSRDLGKPSVKDAVHCGQVRSSCGLAFASIRKESTKEAKMDARPGGVARPIAFPMERSLG